MENEEESSGANMENEEEGSSAKKKKYDIDMCSGPLFPKIVAFALPLMCTNILQLLFNAADIVVVGQFAGDTALAAVGSTGSLINLITNLFLGLSIGSIVVVAKYYGAKKEQALSETVHTTMLVSFICGIFLTVVGILGAESFLVMMQTPPEVLELSALYLRIYFAGIIVMMIYNFGASILRAVGDTKRPFYYLLLAGVLNVGLNLLFVIQFNMSVAGVAIATVISQALSALLIVRALIKEKGAIKLEFKKLRIHKDKLFEIMRIGLPAGLQGMIFSLSNVVIQSSINTFGKDVIAGNSAGANIEGFVYIAMNTFYQAAISFTGQNYGAKEFKRIDRVVLISLGCVTAVGLVLSALTLIFGRTLLSIYASSPEVIEAGYMRMSVVCATYTLCGIMEIFVGYLRGVGYSVPPMIIALIGACILRLLWIAILFPIEGYHTITTVLLSYPVSWIITIIALIICSIIVRKKTMKYQKI